MSLYPSVCSIELCCWIESGSQQQISWGWRARWPWYHAEGRDPPNHCCSADKWKALCVLDFINGGELLFHLQRERFFPEHRARFYAAEIASGLGYLHSIKRVSRDLKPENILLNSVGHVVLTDFGLCKEGIAIHDTTTTFCGTPEYLAPEVIKNQPYDNTVGCCCLGAVLYEMLYGLLEIQNHPFFNHSAGLTLYRRKFHHHLILMWQDQMISGTLIQCLQKKPFHIRCVCLLTILSWTPVDWRQMMPSLVYLILLLQKTCSCSI